MSTNEEMIRQMYGSNLDSKKEQLRTDYETAASDLDAQQEAARKALEKNISATKVQAQKSAMNNEEYYAASGLTSGAKAQARLASENQLQANLTALRTAQQETDAEVERQRALLSKEYASAIRKAQADNDLALAQALYEEAEKQDAKLLEKQEAAANIMAGVGSYDLYGQLYGLSAEDIQRLTAQYDKEQQAVAANIMAQAGDYSRYGALYGLSGTEIQKLNGTASGGSGGSTVNNGNRTNNEIAEIQGFLGVDADGKWGPKSQAAAEELWGITSADEAWKKLTDRKDEIATWIATAIANANGPSFDPRKLIDNFLESEWEREYANAVVDELGREG